MSSRSLAIVDCGSSGRYKIVRADSNPLRRIVDTVEEVNLKNAFQRLEDEGIIEVRLVGARDLPEGFETSIRITRPSPGQKIADELNSQVKGAQILLKDQWGLNLAVADFIGIGSGISRCRYVSGLNGPTVMPLIGHSNGGKALQFYAKLVDEVEYLITQPLAHLSDDDHFDKLIEEIIEPGHPLGKFVAVDFGRGVDLHRPDRFALTLQHQLAVRVVRDYVLLRFEGRDFGDTKIVLFGGAVSHCPRLCSYIERYFKMLNLPTYVLKHGEYACGIGLLEG